MQSRDRPSRLRRTRMPTEKCRSLNHQDPHAPSPLGSTSLAKGWAHPIRRIQWSARHSRKTTPRRDQFSQFPVQTTGLETHSVTCQSDLALPASACGSAGRGVGPHAPRPALPWPRNIRRCCSARKKWLKARRPRSVGRNTAQCTRQGLSVCRQAQHPALVCFFERARDFGTHIRYT